MFRRAMSFLSCSFACLCMIAPPAGFADITTPSGDKFPVPNGVYESERGGTTYDGFDIEMISMNLRGAGPGVDLPPAGRTFRVDSFFDVFVDFQVGGSSGSTFQIDSFFDIIVEITADDTGSGHFETEMLSMDLRGTGPNGPDTLVLRLSTDVPSTGGHEVTDLGSGQFNVDSFFDIFTEVSVDGGSNFFRARNSVRLSLNSSVPEPATIALVTPLAVCVMMRRRRR